MTFSLTTDKRGYAGIKFDRDFLGAIKDQSRPLVEVLFAYSFLLAETDFAYQHVLLFSKIWSEEVEKASDLKEVTATLDINVYRQAIDAVSIHPDIRNLTRKVTRPSLLAVNERTRFDVSYNLEARGGTEAKKTRQKTTHITFKIRLKSAYQLELNFEANRLESLDKQLRTVVDYDRLLAVPASRQKTLQKPPSELSEYTDDNAELFEVTQKALAIGVSSSDLTKALQNWKVRGVIEIWETFEARRSNSKAAPVDNPKAYLLTLLKKGEGRKTPEQRKKEAETKERVKGLQDKAKLAEAQKAKEQQIVAIERAHRARAFAEIEAIVADLPDTENQDLLEQCEAQIDSSDFAVGDFRKNKWNSVIAGQDIIRFFTGLYPSEITKIEDIAKDQGVENWKEFSSK